ncbi:MAG: M1 family aminopeptidase [Bacteroidota bacterium]
MCRGSEIYKFQLVLFLAFLSLFASTLAQEISYPEYFRSEKQFYMKKFSGRTMFPGRDDIDVYYYRLDLSIDYASKRIAGNTLLGVASRKDTLNAVTIELRNNMTVDSVIAGGIRSVYSRNNDRLTINLPHDLTTSEKVLIRVYYAGNPSTSGFGSFEFSQTRAGKPVIWSLSEPFGAPDWFPCNDTPSDKADSSDVVIRIAKPLKVVSNGSLETVTENGDGTWTWHWKNHHTIANYLISVAIAEYSEYTNYFRYSPSDSMPVIHYIYPESLTSSLKKNLDNTVNMLKIFSDKFGLYPFVAEKYGHAQFGWGGGMEHQTVSSMGAFDESIISHELAHQWFGDMITCAGWNDIWLNEGFATYAEGVFLEFKYGRDQYDSYMGGVMMGARYAGGSLFVTDSMNIDQIFDYSRTYLKGAVVLHMLRGVTGDSLFYRILKTYASDPLLKGRAARTADFQRVAETVSGMDLDYFFSEWIYGRGYPNYNVTWMSQPEADGKYKLEINITQTQNGYPQYFTMPINFRVEFAGGDTSVVLFNDNAAQKFSIELSARPFGVEMDPQNFILKNAIVTGNESDSRLPATFELKQNYPNPFNPSTVIPFDLSSSGMVDLKIYDLLGREVSTLIGNKEFQAGHYTHDFRAAGLNLQSGVYFYSLHVKSRSGQEVFSSARKMVLIK